jgi:hypothetical protein
MPRRTILALVLALAGCIDRPTGPGGGVEEPEVSRGAYQLLVERYSPTLQRSFYTMAPDGSLVGAFLGVPDDARVLAPAPDGRTIAYLRRALSGDQHVWLMNRDGGERRPLLEGTRVVAHVAWSPDGARLAFEQTTLTETADIWVMSASGAGATNLTPDPFPGVWFDRHPTWSPDGARIAFSSTRSGPTRLWTMRATGGDFVQVLPQTVEASERSPAWSPDGAWIAFLGADANVEGIGVVRPNGADYRLFPVAGDVSPPVWAPDGRLLYTTDAEGNAEVYALDPTTGASTNLTRHTDHDVRVTPLRYVAPAAWLGYAAPARYTTNAANPPGIGVGDLNEDGLPEVAVLQPAQELVRLLGGTGGGGLAPLGALTAPADQRALAVADVSRDGTADLVVLGPQELVVYRGGPEGPGLPTTHPLGGDARGLAAFDFDADGSTDLAAVHEGGGSGFRMLVHGARSDDGELIAISDYGTPFPGAGRACAGDVTGEGAGDVVVLTSGAAAPLVLAPGHGDITFGEPVVAATAPPTGAADVPLCADLNGDRRADVALLQPGQAAALSLLQSTGAGFGAPVPVAVRGTSVAAADVDRDGDADLLLAAPSQGAVLFLRNRGDGRFAQPTAIATGGAPLRIAAAEMNGDLWPDLVAADPDGTVTVLLNRGR